MIPPQNTMTQTDTLEGEEIEFGIGDPRWMMRVNSKLYSDVTTAIIREYSTNAYDANVMAGNPDPIKVTLPSELNPYFTVEDAGTGMDMSTFREIYTQFGTSNKRNSNETNGMLGLGSKSGVAYTTSFTVTSVKDGLKVEGLVQRKPDWSITLKIIKSSKTDEPNGTKIVIPVHNVREFVYKANNFYKFWLPGRVLLNGREPEHYVGEKVFDGLYYSNDYDTSYIVMGNVAYRINNPDALFRNSNLSRMSFVAYVDNGDVEFTPSREDLEYSERTKATLQKVIDDFEAKITKAAQDAVNAATTHAEAYVAWKEWTERVGAGVLKSLTFKGDEFSASFPIIGYRWMSTEHPRYSEHRSKGHTVNHWQVSHSPQTMFVVDHDINLTARHKTMAKEVAKKKGWTAHFVIFTSATKVNSPWISQEQVITWEKVKELAPKVAHGGGSWNSGNTRVKGSWDYVTVDGYKTEQPLPTDPNLNVYWISVQDSKNTNVKEILAGFDTKGVAVLVPANREPKFRRENPTVKHLVTHFSKNVVQNGESLLSDDAKLVMSLDWSFTRRLERLDIDKIDDPDFAWYRDLLKKKSALLADYHKHRSLARTLGLGYSWFKDYNCNSSEPTLFSKYPLLSALSGSTHDDVYLYINAKYAALVAESENSDDE